jgi:hypothetical protein
LRKNLEGNDEADERAWSLACAALLISAKGQSRRFDSWLQQIATMFDAFTHQVQVVARQQNDVTGSKHEALSILAVDPDTEFTLDDVVIKNQMRCWPESGRAMFWRYAGRHTPWRKEIGVQEHAASQMRHSQNVGQCIHTDLSSEAGVLVMSQGTPVIDPCLSGDLKIAASADRLVCAIGAPLRKRRLK